MNLIDPLPIARMLSLMPTFQCTAACAHCGTLSHPRETTWLPLDQMLSAIDQAAKNGYRVVVFTGGEPTLAGEDLLVAISRAAAHGLIARVVTNAWWASTDGAAHARIAEMAKAGLRQFNCSTGDQHARFVPIDNVMRAAYAAAAHS